jgi:outer membrane protein assembly factor BamB
MADWQYNFLKNLYLVGFYKGGGDLFETLWAVYDKGYKLVSKNLIDIDAEIHGELLIGTRRFKREDYVAGSRCSVLCVNAVSGEPVWEYDYAWMNEGARKFCARIAVSGNCVLVTCCRFLVGLCINTGKELFRYDVAGQTGDDSFSHPVIDGYVSVATPHAIEKNQSAVFYVDRLDSNCSEVMSYVMAFSYLDGRVLWIKPSKRRTRFHVRDGDILFSSFEGDMTAYDVATGDIIWRADKTPSMGLVTSNATSLCVSNHYNDGFSIYCQVDGRESMESRNKKNAKKIRPQISVDNLVSMLKKEFLGSSCNKEEVMSLDEFLDFSASWRDSRREYRMREFIEANPELCHAVFAFIVTQMDCVNKDNKNFNGNLEI